MSVPQVPEVGLELLPLGQAFRKEDLWPSPALQAVLGLWRREAVSVARCCLSMANKWQSGNCLSLNCHWQENYVGKAEFVSEMTGILFP